MAATSVREPEISSHTAQRPLDLVGASELELARLLTWETTDQQQAVDRITQQMLHGEEKKPLDGVTGKIALEGIHHFSRSLAPAEIDGGRVIPLRQ